MMITVAILGASAPGVRLARALLGFGDRCEVGGIWDPDPKAALKASRTLDVACHDDLDAALERVDAAVVCAGLEVRARTVATALAHGLDVLVETPIAANHHQTQQLLGGLVRAPRRPVAMVSHPDLYGPAVAALQRLIGSQTIVALDIERHEPVTRAALDPDFDIVDDTMMRDVQLVSALLGRRIAVTQAAGARSRPSQPFDHARALLVLDDNTLVTLTASRSGSARVRHLRVTTTKAHVICDLDSGVVESTQSLPSPRFGELESAVSRIDVQYRDRDRSQAGAFLDAIERRAKPRLSFGAVLDASQAADAIRSRIALVDRREPSVRGGKLRAA